MSDPRYARQGYTPHPQLSPNAFEDRFYALTSPDVREYYRQAAAQAGLQYNPNKHKLTPLLLTEALDIFTDADLNNRQVVLSAGTPRGELRFYFSDPCFINRVSAVVLAPRLTQDGQPEQNFFNASVEPTDYVYIKLFREGSNQVYMQRSVAMSEFTGTGVNTYLFDLIPVLERGETLVAELSLLPPGRGNVQLQNPPFVESIGFLDVTLHCHRWDPFGA